ncbi:hypothetical protein HK098_007622 [Nowakowskiella sp. JEL0407]|nr:hypothetical protein HK098_007622 [Nowakowskiella sp. JEL0407]
MSAGDWTNIESDPGVFTSLVEELGVTGIQFEELFDLSQLEELSPVYGLVFLFKYEGSQQPQSVDYTNTNVFFARQVIQNSCATQAILSILLNNPEISIGPILSEFKLFCNDFDADTKGWAISNSDQIRLVHNSFAKPDPFLIEATGEGGEDAFHFISYVPIDGVLWELDGLQSGPINHGAFVDGDWFSKGEIWMIRSVIEARIALYAASEIRFNLMAVIKNREQLYTELLALAQDENQKKELLMLLSAAHEKREHWKKENQRRKHNFIGFTFQLLQEMAKSGLLQPAIEK